MYLFIYYMFFWYIELGHFRLPAADWKESKAVFLKVTARVPVPQWMQIFIACASLAFAVESTYCPDYCERSEVLPQLALLTSNKNI